MKLLYILAAIMFAGILLMTVASLKVFSTVKATEQANRFKHRNPNRPKVSQVEKHPEVLPYVTMSYLGLVLFLCGGVGAMFAAFKAMTQRF